MLTYPFTAEEFAEAYAEWGCNCGPSALAFATRKKPCDVRFAIPNFDERRYTSPTMMKEALSNLDQPYQVIRGKHHRDGVPDFESIMAMFCPSVALVRIQWAGPWAMNGKTGRWSARQTHWIATWWDQRDFVFDCNSGITSFNEWKINTVPKIVESIKNASGDWFPLNIWRLKENARYRRIP